MATTAQQVFEAAMHLCDEVNESTGRADTADTKEYKNRVLPILNVLRMECFTASDTYEAQPGRRSICPEITGLDEPIGLDDGLCQGVLPYGLAAHLMLGEDNDKASYFQQRYEELLEGMRRGLPGGFGEIDNPYGGIELGQFARW